VGDVLLANHEIYAIFQMHPSSQYFLHVAGGGLVDLGFWDEGEELAEALALVNGHWFEGPEVDWGVDENGAFFRLSGTTEAVHFLDSAGTSPSSRSVEWRLGREGRFIEANGADEILFLGEEGGEVNTQGEWRGQESLFSGGAVLSSSDEDVVLEAREAPYSDAVRVKLGVDVFPSRYSRKTVFQAAEEAIEDGASLVMVSSVDEVASGVVEEDWPIRMLMGSETRSPSAGRVWTWPWSSKSHKPAHGAAAWKDLTAQEVLASAKNGASGRRAMVDMDWIEAAGPMKNWTLVPELVWIESPEDAARVRELWELGAGLAFVSEHTWLPVDSSPLPALSTMERELLWGQTSVSSGPSLLGFRESSETEGLDSVRFVLRGLSEAEPVSARLWSATDLLDELVWGADGVDFRGEFLAPADQDVWVEIRGSSVWALSSVHSASLLPEPNCTGMSDADTVFDSDPF
jgi:hypothetical protein